MIRYGKMKKDTVLWIFSFGKCVTLKDSLTIKNWHITAQQIFIRFLTCIMVVKSLNEYLS